MSAIGRHKRLLLVVLGCALLAWLVAHLGAATITDALDRAGLRIVWLIAVYFAGTAIVAIPWTLLLPPEARPGFAALLASRIAAAGINAVDPVLGVSGEPCRLLWLRPADRPAGAAALLADRVLFWLATSVVLALASAILLAIDVVPAIYPLAGLGVAAIWLAVAVLFTRVALSHGVVGPVARLARRILRRSPAATDAGRHDVDARLRELLARPGPLAAGLALHVVGRVVLAAELWVALLAVHGRLDAATAIYLVALPPVIALVGAPVPGQVGVQEGAMVLAFSAAGLNPRLGLAVVTLQRVRQLFSVALGGFLLATRRPRSPAPTGG